ncbi:MAG: hypothetical protein KGL04_05705, partial [Elusimicrobia bacterium]|nr:hypothetical protein [Elusimicrobiota bacterium]
MSRLYPGPSAGRLRALLTAVLAAAVLLAGRRLCPAAEVPQTAEEAPAFPGAFPAALPAPLAGMGSSGFLPAQDGLGLDDVPDSAFSRHAVLAPR